MGGQALLYMLNDGINIAKFQPFFGGQFKLPSDALFGKTSTTDAARRWAVG